MKTWVVRKHLLRLWPILARSSTLYFAGAVNTRQKMTVHINNLVRSEFPDRSSRSASSLISTLIFYLRNKGYRYTSLIQVVFWNTGGTMFYKYFPFLVDYIAKK